MATSIDYIQYVCDQIRDCGFVTYKKMFGEYMAYVDGKPILLVCDNCVYVKMLPEIKDLMKNMQIAKPYNGAKDHYILDIDDTELTKSVVDILTKITPLPKPKTRKS